MDYRGYRGYQEDQGIQGDRGDEGPACLPGNFRINTISVYNNAYKSIGYIDTNCSCFVVENNNGEKLVATASHSFSNTKTAIFPTSSNSKVSM